MKSLVKPLKKFFKSFWKSFDKKIITPISKVILKFTDNNDNSGKSEKIPIDFVIDANSKRL